MNKTEPDKFFQMRTNQEFLNDLDALRLELHKKTGNLASKAEILRVLVKNALQGNCRVHENVNEIR